MQAAPPATASATLGGQEKTETPQSTLVVAGAVLLGLLAVGWVDYATGVEVRAFPLYFLPLALAAKRLGMHPAIASAVVATLVWVVALAAAGRQYSHPAIWLINSLTQGSAFVLFAVLVARLQTALGRERKLARYDALTGLPNRREFARLAERALGRCRRTNTAATLAYLDLDHFKQANDRFGHARGDLLLGEVGRILQEGLRTQDVVGRLGGDEFAVCLPDTNAAQAREVLGRLRDRFGGAALISDCGVTVSIGAVATEHHDADLEAWLQAADTVMYRAKAAGRDQLWVEPFPALPPSREA